MSKRNWCWIILPLCLLVLITSMGCKRKRHHRGADSGAGAGGGGAGPVGVAVNIVAPGTAEDEQFDGDPGFAVGTDGFARLAYLATGASEIRYARRRPDGTWTAAITVSTTAFTKDLPQLGVVPVGPNAGTSFIFWTETDLGVVPHVHMARVNAADPPAILTPDAEISDGPLPAGIVGVNFVALTVTMSVKADALNGDIYAAWGQEFDGDGPGAGVVDDCVIAGIYLAGGPGATVGPNLAEPDIKVGLSVNNADAGAATLQFAADPAIQLVYSPLPAGGGGGTMHAFYVITNPDGTGLDMHTRRRTAGGAFTPAAPGIALSAAPAPAFFRFLRVAVEGDGDLYATWAADAFLPPTGIHHSRAAVGTDFLAAGSSVVTLTPGGAGVPDSIIDLGIALDGATPIVGYKIMDGTDMQAAASVGTANASGPFPVETTLHAITTVAAGEGGGRIAMASETGGRMSIVYDAPPAAGAPLEIFGVIRPPGGAFGAEANLSVSAAVISRLAGSASLLDTADFAWLEGPNAGPRDVFDIHYSLGAFGPPVNLSMSAATDSHGGENGAAFGAGNVGVAPGGGGLFHVFFREHLGAVQHDPFHIVR